MAIYWVVFITSWMSAAIFFAVYWWICAKQQGQRVTGKLPD